MPKVPEANLNTTIAALQHEASVQAESAAAWDAKLMGILAFMAAAAGVLITVGDALARYRWILLVGAGMASLVALAGLLGIGDTESGPDPAEFYDKYGAATTDAFLMQMIDDYRALRVENKSRVGQRRDMASVSFALAALAAVAFGLARAAVTLLS
ncbi:MAG TPA: hypothetical protein VH061_06145 [Solirubrobacteraceae bacterium]|jgi:hypothetical protein|nr:hypothetical protein [Solirubrobacteraceae bacterium]